MGHLDFRLTYEETFEESDATNYPITNIISGLQLFYVQIANCCTSQVGNVSTGISTNRAYERKHNIERSYVFDLNRPEE